MSLKSVFTFLTLNSNFTEQGTGRYSSFSGTRSVLTGKAVRVVVPAHSDKQVWVLLVFQMCILCHISTLIITQLFVDTDGSCSGRLSTASPG